MTDRKKEIQSILKSSRLRQNYDIEGHKHSSSYMAKPQLKQIAEQAAAIDERLNKDEPLHDWAESHIAQCNAMINSVYRYIFYKEE
jgi:hypothetical protein